MNLIEKKITLNNITRSPFLPLTNWFPISSQNLYDPNSYIDATSVVACVVGPSVNTFFIYDIFRIEVS
jgi:hypothetical protein